MVDSFEGHSRDFKEFGRVSEFEVEEDSVSFSPLGGYCSDTDSSWEDGGSNMDCE